MARKKLLTEGEVRQFMKLANLGSLSENYFTHNPLDEQDEEEFAAAEVGPEGGEEVELGAVEDEVPPVDDAGLGGEEGGEAEDLVMGLLQAVQDWAEEQGVEMALDGDEEGGEEFEDVEGAEAELEEPLPGGGELEVGAEEEEVVPGNMDLYEGDDWGGNKGDYKRRKGKKTGDVGGHYKDDEKEELDEIGGRITHDTSRPATGRESSGMGARGRGGGRAAETDEDCPVGHVAVGGKCVPARDAGQQGGQQDLSGVPGFGESLDQDAIVAEVARRVAARLNADKRKEQVAEQLAQRIFERLTSK